MILVYGIINIDPANIDKAKELTDTLVAETRKESGNISYEYFHALGNPGRMSVVEEWESQEAIDSHMASPHMAAFFGAAGDLGISGVAIDQYEVTEKKKMM